MKTKLSLTVIGVIMILQSIAYPLFSETFTDMMFNVGDEAKEALTLFQIAVAPTFFMVGLMICQQKIPQVFLIFSAYYHMKCLHSLFLAPGQS